MITTFRSYYKLINGFNITINFNNDLFFIIDNNTHIYNTRFIYNIMIFIKPYVAFFNLQKIYLQWDILIIIIIKNN